MSRSWRNAMKKILDKRQMTESDWQDYRSKQQGIGGSEVSSIIGINPYKSRFTLWAEKTGNKEREQVDNEYIEWGNRLEPLIRKKFQDQTGFKTQKCNFVLQHDDYDFMIANIDGEYKDPSKQGKGVLEIKTTSEWNRKEWDGNNVPDSYMAQLQHYLAVTGYEYGAIAVLIGGNKFRWFEVERRDDIIEGIINAEIKFLKAVNLGEYDEEIGGSEDETQYINSLYPDSIDEESSLPPIFESMAMEYKEIEAQAKEIKNRMEAIKNQIKLEAKDIQRLKGNNVRINMPTIVKTLFDSKKFQSENETLYEQYKTKESKYRSFNITLLEDAN